MKIINMGRGQGKTKRLIQYSSINNVPIVCWSRQHCKIIKEHGICYDYQCEGYYTYEGFFDDYDSYLESYCGKFTTKSGDKVVAFGRYGYDG